MLLSGAPARSAWRQVLNPPVIAVPLGLVLNFAGGRE
jgi:hypothetical protein